MAKKGMGVLIFMAILIFIAMFAEGRFYSLVIYRVSVKAVADCMFTCIDSFIRFIFYIFCYIISILIVLSFKILTIFSFIVLLLSKRYSLNM